MIVYSATKQQFVNDVRSNAIAALIEDYNETVRNESIALLPCAYLHNMKARDAINDDFYAEHIKKAPVFISPDALKLSEFLKQSVKYGDSDNIMYRIEHGKIKPSKKPSRCPSIHARR